MKSTRALWSRVTCLWSRVESFALLSIDSESTSSQFRPERSSIYAVWHGIHLLDSIYRAADNELATLLLPLELSAAFNTINHAILLNRFTSSFGIMGSSHNWLKSYLQQVFLGHFAIVGSGLDYVNSFLTGISSCNIHHLQRIQNSLARVITRSITNTTSALNSLHWLPIQQRINFTIANLIHRSFHHTGPQYVSSLLHP